MSSMPVREASDASLTSSPPIDRTIHSATHRWRTADDADGTCAVSQRIFMSDGLELSRRPVARWKSRAPTTARTDAASPRGSNQARAGAHGSPVGSTSTPASAIPVTPIERTLTRSPAWAAASAHTAMTVSASTRGSASASGPECRHGVSREASDLISPVGVTAIALIDVVPTSTPTRTSCAMTCPPR